MQIVGIVAGGSAKASAFGYPTANIPLSGSDASGSYAALVMVEGKEYKAVAYADQDRGVLESHLFNFSGDLYGKEISVTLSARLRAPQSFSSEEALIAAIASDVEAARTHEAP